MILGMSRDPEARYHARERDRERWRYWHRRYAWRPVKLIDGRWAWLEPIEITGYVENPEIVPGTPFNLRICSTSFCARLAAEARA